MPGNVANIARRWAVLSGKTNWKGMLKPLDNDLRTYIIHYGDMEAVTYANFITEAMSKYTGGGIVPKSTLLNSAGAMRRDQLMKYTVTRYFYATSQIDMPGLMVGSSTPNPMYKSSNWMGFIAVATDEGKRLLGRRDIVVAWRGTLTPMEWYKDMEGQMVPAKRIFKTSLNPRVHQGFFSVYTSNSPMSRFNKTSAREQVMTEVKRLLAQYKNEPTSVTITGHSLGAAIATLCATDFALQGIKATAFPFASPYVGDHTFKQVVDQLTGKGMLHILRIANQQDIVTKVPPPMLGFVHVGEVLAVSSGISDFLTFPPSVAGPHDMEVYLHCVAGCRGSLRLAETGEGTDEDKGEEGFDLKGRRDIALVNKFTNMLKPKFLVPGNWWCVENKGMEIQPDGKYEMTAGDWILHEPTEDGTSGVTDDHNKDGLSDDDNKDGVSDDDNKDDHPLAAAAAASAAEDNTPTL